MEYLLESYILLETARHFYKQNFKSVAKIMYQQNIYEKSSFFVSENENLKKIIQIYVLQSQKCWGDKR